MKDLIGQAFNRFTVIGKMNFRSHGAIVWRCKCICGNLKEVRDDHLVSGRIKSCGCLNTETRRAMCIERSTTHGMRHTTEYGTWQNMINRCHNPRTSGYYKYGKRGIKVCSKWRKSFEAFFKDMGAKPSAAHSIDRINNEGDYRPSNCRWALASQQSRNKRNNVWVKYKGRKVCLTEACELLNIFYGTAMRRRSKGLSLKEALNNSPHIQEL